MKHFWFGAGLLAALLALSLWTMGFLEDIHEPIRQDLDAAAEAVLSGDWNRGRALANQAEDAWEQKRNLIAALSSHLAIEEIDSLFRQLSVYARLPGTGLPHRRRQRSPSAHLVESAVNVNCSLSAQFQKRTSLRGAAFYAATWQSRVATQRLSMPSMWHRSGKHNDYHHHKFPET